MKKVFLLFMALILTATSIWADSNDSWKTVTNTVKDMKKSNWEGGNTYTTISIDNVITLSHGKYYSTSQGGELRYYYQNNDNGRFTISAKAGAIIRSVKLTWKGNNNAVLTKTYQGSAISSTSGEIVTSGKTYTYDYVTSITYYVGITASASSQHVNVTGYEIKYFDPSTGVVVTKSGTDLFNDLGLKNGTPYQDVALNQAISLGTTKSGTVKMTNSMQFNCYSWLNPIYIKAREGATIRYVKITYPTSGNAVLSTTGGTSLTKYIAADSIVYVGANSITLYVGSTNSSSATIALSKFYVNYIDKPEVVVENFKNCSSTGSTGSVNFAGVDGKYNWTITNFSRNMERMYYEQATKLNKGGKISTNFEGGLKEIAFDWHPSANSAVKFNVIAGDSTYPINKAAMGGTYTLNFNKKGIKKSSGTFSIEVDANSGTTMEFGHISLTPYLLYTKKSETIKAKDYASQNFKYTNTALINNTAGEGTISYAVSGENANKIASINSSTGEVTILGEGTVTVTASWEGVTTSYQLTIQLETPTIGFAESEVSVMKSAQSHKQTLTFTTPTSGTGSYYKVSGPASGTVDADGTVHFTEAGDYVIRGVFNTLPYKPDSATYTLKVTELNVPELSFAASSIEKPVGAAGFINSFSKPDDDTGAVTYESGDTNVATVEENGDGTVTIVGAGTTTITASVAETSKYAAGNKSYTLKVFPLSDISFAGDTSVYLNAPAFTRVVKVNAGDGTITYKSSNTNIATVNDNGVVTLKGDVSGLDTITAIIAKTENFWADTATYTLNVSSLKMPTASFVEGTVNKVQGFEAFTNTSLTTTSDGVKTYESSDTRVATVNAETGEVTKGEKPGQTVIKVKIAASATWEKIEASYTLNVSAAKVADLHLITKTVAQMRGTAEWTGGSQHPNIDIVEGIVLSDGKYYSNSDGEHFRYYYNADPKYVSSTTFTIQAKAGVIIQTVKINYIKGNDKMVLADANYNGAEVPSANRIISGTTYKVDANSVTYYVGRTGTLPSSNNFVNVTGYEIKYFDPSTGVAVTKHAFDLGKNQSLADNTCYQNVVINKAITLHADADNTMRYSKDGYFNCYRWCGPIDIKARKGATIHHVKVTYTTTTNAVLTKYYGTDGKNIPAIDRIASDSIIYVNADSLRLYVGSTTSDGGTAAIKKIYVNYTDNSEVTVDNFDNCKSQGTGGSVDVAGVDGKYNWSIYNFSRSDANRMYYDQSIKLNQEGKIVSNYTGGLKEVAFDWHPTESGKAVKFTVNAGDSSWTVSKTDAAMDKIYTFNFQKTANKTNGEFSIAVDKTSGTQVEIGHISLTPYIIYACKDTIIAAKNYKDAGYKFTNPSLINNTGETVAYSITGDASIAEIDPASGEVTIKGGGTVTVNAKADGATASYQLTINLESTSATFAEHAVERLVSDGSYKQELQVETEATEGNEITYSFIGKHEGASIDSATGLVTFSQAGQFKILGQLAQNMPYAAAQDSFILTVTSKDVPHIAFTVADTTCNLSDGAFTVALNKPAGVGALSYVSTNKAVATVDEQGEVTPLKAGSTIIKAYVAESESYAADSAQYTLTVLGEPMPGGKTVVGNIAAIAERDHWADGNYYSYFKLDDVISVSDSNRNKLNAHYLESEQSVRFYQNQTKGQFFIRAKAGAIIQSVQFTYSSENGGIITNNYGSDGKSIAAANQYLSGVTYKFDANKLTFYTGSTADKNNGEVHITSIVVRYFNPETGVAVTKTMADIGRQFKYKTEDCPQSVAVNNVISMNVNNSGTQKYLINKNICEFRYYQNCGAVTFQAREGAMIHYLKISYSSIDDGVLNKIAASSSVKPEDQIASDSILYVNASSLTLYIGKKTAGSGGQVRINKVYVNYTDGNAIVDNFDNCTKLYGGDTPTEVMGVDSTFIWNFTQFNRDSLRRIGYDQAMMLRQQGGKVVANNVDGGVKEVSFDWFASNSNEGVKFNVKAGDKTFTVDSAATLGYYPMTYTLTDIKTNGAFSIEMDPASGSQMEVGHISLTPYLFYTKKVDTVLVGTVYKPNLVDFRGSDEDITFSSSKDSVAYVAADGTVTADHVGTATITASWNGVSTSYQIVVEGDKTVIALKRNDGTDDADTLINNYGETMPEMTLPTRANYRFNAYFPDASASNPQERITVTAWDEKTYYVANVKHSNKTVTMTDAGRRWVYDRPTYDLYAQWMPEVTIVLDNQDATVAGTTQVKTAHCPNNASVNLSQNITVPTKEGGIFGGYYTEPLGKGDTLINENGSFKKSVAGYTNETKMWQKDEGATLYAEWLHHITYAPGGRHCDTCDVPVDSAEHHKGDIITLVDTLTFSNPGHTWLGWKVSYIRESDSTEVVVAQLKQSGETFSMPDHDVTICGIWQLTDTVEIMPRIVKDTLVSTMAGDNVISIVAGGNMIVDAAKTFTTIYVNDGGKISAGQKLTVKDLVIRATAGSTPVSGQIVDATDSNIQITNAFFDLSLAKGGTNQQWHAFTVPFKVNMMTGIYDLEGNQLKAEVNYAIMVYQGNVRSKGEYGWKKVQKTGNTILQPGTFYIMATDGHRTTYRMKMDGSFSVAGKNITVYDYDSTGTVAQDKGWNGIGNSQLQYCSVDATVQVLDPVAYVFRAIPTDQAKDFAVGTPFFYQADDNGSITLNTNAAPARMRAITSELKEIAVSLANEDYTDELYISSTDEAKNEYQIGRDLIRMSMTDAPEVPQICAKAYNTSLSVIDLPMVNDEVTYALSLYAPKKSNYTMTAQQVEGYEIFLTKDGEIIWNLSMSAYDVELTKGDTDTYGLLVRKVDNTTTMLEGVRGNADGVQKFIYNEQLILIRDGKQYNGTGSLIK